MDGWNAIPDHILFKFRDWFKSIDPRRLRPIEKRNQWVGSQRRLAPQTHRVRQYATSSLAEQFLIGTPRKPGKSEQEIHQAQIEDGMADFDRNPGKAGVMHFK